MMTWTINGRVYEPMAVAEDKMVYRDVPIAWEWINNSPIPHPMHIHNVMFQVVQRNAASTPSGYQHEPTRASSTPVGKIRSSSGQASASRLR